MRLSFGIVLVSAALSSAGGCRKEPTPAAPVAPAPPSAPPPGMMVSTGGRNVWPPAGPGCERLIGCCDAAAVTASFIQLACRLSVARAPVDCGKALGTVTNILKEKGLTPPAACGL